MDAKDRELAAPYYEQSVVWLYNPVRLHETLNYLSPDTYEAENAPAVAA
jgi:transposase InsO family protein